MNNAKQQIIILIVVGILIVGLGLLKIWPLHSKLENLRKETHKSKATILQGKSKSAKISELKSRLRKLEAKVGDFRQKVPANNNLGNFLQKIADLMDRYELSDQSIRPGQEVQAKQVNCVIIEMSCKGDLNQLFAFYKSLEDMDRVVRIEDVKLNNHDSLNGQVTMNTKSVIFYKQFEKTGKSNAG